MLTNLYVVTISSWRHKWHKEHETMNDENIASVSKLIEELQKKHGSLLHVIGQNDDVGFGSIVRRQCYVMNIPHVNYLCRLENMGKNPGVNQIFHLARHASLIEMSNEFHMFTLDSRVCSIEDLVHRVQKTTMKPYVVYGQDGKVLEFRA